MRLMILIFVLAAFVLAAMRSMAQQDPCLLPPPERPDYCTGNAPPESTGAVGTITPAATAAAWPTPEITPYPAPGTYPAPSLPPRSGRQGQKISPFLEALNVFCNKNYDLVGEKSLVQAQKGRFWICFEPILHEKLTRWPMGYIHDSSMKYFVPPALAGGSGGTWTHSMDGTFWSLSRAAGAGTFYLAIPVAVPHQNGNENRGSRIASVDVYFKISDANLTSLAAEFNLQTLPSTGELDSPSNPVFTYDTDHDAAGERVAQGSHVMTLTLTTATWIQGTQYLRADLIAVAPSNTVFEFFGARTNYTLRI